MFTLLLAQGGEFAFVVFQARRAATCCRPDVASLLIGAVALSMLLVAAAAGGLDKWLLPRYGATRRRPRWTRSREQQDARCIDLRLRPLRPDRRRAC